ncbi:MAG: MerR family transcriptional regulator [Clostridia bacterium]
MGSASRQIPEAAGISAAARECGLSKESLRIWERRYGFPRPRRSPSGERLYGADQLEKLRLIKRLMDTGLAPRKLVGASVAQLRQMAAQAGAAAPAPAQHADEIAAILQALRERDVARLRARLRRQLARLGTRAFVIELAAPLAEHVGAAWARGDIGIAQEHLFSEQLESLLRSAGTPAHAEAEGPAVLLATLPGEQHRLGLLMLEALLAGEGAACIPLGTQTPVAEIALAAQASRVAVVALSFSAAFPRRAALRGLAELRARLPASIAVWAGGGALRGARKRVEGVVMPMTLESALAELPKRLARAA